MATYAERPVEIIKDFGNGITRIKFLDCGKPGRVNTRRYVGESDAEYGQRIASYGISDVPTDRITED